MAIPAQRERLPDQRINETLLVDHIWNRAAPGEQLETMTVTVGRYEARGKIGEVFVN